MLHRPGSFRGRFGLWRGFPHARLIVEKLVEIHPEAAVEFENGERPKAGVHFLSLAQRGQTSQKQKKENQPCNTGKSRFHSWNGNGNAICPAHKLRSSITGSVIGVRIRWGRLIELWVQFAPHGPPMISGMKHARRVIKKRTLPSAPVFRGNRRHFILGGSAGGARAHDYVAERVTVLPTRG